MISFPNINIARVLVKSDQRLTGQWRNLVEKIRRRFSFGKKVEEKQQQQNKCQCRHYKNRERNEEEKEKWCVGGERMGLKLEMKDHKKRREMGIKRRRNCCFVMIIIRRLDPIFLQFSTHLVEHCSTPGFFISLSLSYLFFFSSWDSVFCENERREWWNSKRAFVFVCKMGSQ